MIMLFELVGLKISISGLKDIDIYAKV